MPLCNLFMNVMQQPEPDLPYGTVPRPRAQMVRLVLVFTFIWQENVAKLPKVPGAPRTLNPTREIT